MIIKDALKGFVAGVLLMSIVGYGYISANKADPKDLSFKLTGPTGSGAIDLSIKGSVNTIDYLTVLKQLFSNELMRDGAINWLAKTQHLYSIESTDLTQALKTRACDPFPEQPVELRLLKRQECANKPANDAIRKLAASGEAPFHTVGVKERIGTQGEDGRKPNSGVALVCNDSSYVNKKMVVVNNAGFTKDFVGTPGYPCPDAKLLPALQLNLDDARELFGPKLPKNNYAIVYIGR